jgi:hypothetical protein
LNNDNNNNKHQGLGHLAHSVSRVTAALSNVIGNNNNNNSSICSSSDDDNNNNNSNNKLTTEMYDYNSM